MLIETGFPCVAPTVMKWHKTDLSRRVQTTAGKEQTCHADRAYVGSFTGGKEGRGERERECRESWWEEKEKRRGKETDAERGRGRSRQSFDF